MTTIVSDSYGRFRSVTIMGSLKTMELTSPANFYDPESNSSSTESTPLLPFHSFKPRRRPQIIASLIVTIGAFGLGNALGWSSPALPDLEEDPQFGELTRSMKSWIGSIVNLGALGSGFVVGYAIDHIGRKLTLMIISIPFALGWILIACSKSFGMILAGRFITGFCGGAFTLVAPVYISEIAWASIRGGLCSAVTLFLVLGILFTYILGAFLSWVWLSIISASIPLVFFICMIYMPESPTYLLANKRSEEASESLQWLRGASRRSQIEEELMKIQHGINENSSGHSIKWTDLFSPPMFRPIAICLMLMFFQQLGGINAVIFYSSTIFKASGTHINPNLAAIIVASTQVMMNGISTMIVDRAGRKLLLIISEVGMAISLFALAAFFYLKQQNGGVPPENLGWLPLASLTLYMITYNIALDSVPWVMMGEILPPQVKGFASALASSLCWCLSFIVTKNFQVVTLWLGEFTIFCIFGVISVLGAIFALVVVPETKGKSLDEIQALFRR